MKYNDNIRAVFRWRFKVIRRLRLLHLSDWLERLAPVFQPMRIKTKTNRTMYAWLFLRFEQVTGTLIARNCDWFMAQLLWFWFFYSHLKTTLLSANCIMPSSIFLFGDESLQIILAWYRAMKNCHFLLGTEEI